ncbi:MAG: UxaA family hydrolase [Alphaproteobacteria bacterium]|nr:UxaA family hydrolase [Alphaproteobacteria bacterium]MCY4496649.1 UxaA family hydrolase [Rhodospirillaceae bacterium]
MTRAILLNESDNVATLIDDGSSGDDCLLQGEGSGAVKLGRDIPFGHKVAIADIGVGGEVIKYGQVIGLATEVIPTGQHAHVHNIESRRGRGDKSA